MKKGKKFLISMIGILIIFVLFATIWNFFVKSTNNENGEISARENVIEISMEDSVTDECTEEWEEYNNELQTAFEQASSNITEDTTHYLIKSQNGYICVFYINKNNDELLYKKTSIPIDYLSEEDIANLEKGIEVIGNETLNKMLEDFE